MANFIHEASGKETGIENIVSDGCFTTRKPSIEIFIEALSPAVSKKIQFDIEDGSHVNAVLAKFGQRVYIEKVKQQNFFTCPDFYKVTKKESDVIGWEAASSFENF